MTPDVPPLPPQELALTLEIRRNTVLSGMHTPPTAQCFLREAERNEVDPIVLLAVMKTEGGRPGEFALNRNGSVDFGPMSINSVWLPTLAQRLNLSESEVRQKLASDGCTNVAAAAWILGRKIAETGNVWEGVARFHSNNPQKQATYLKRVHSRLASIIDRMLAVPPRQ